MPETLGSLPGDPRPQRHSGVAIGSRDARVTWHVQAVSDRSAPGPPPFPPAVPDTAHWLVFSLEGRRYALPLSAVDRVVRAVEITPLPLAPAIVLGAIDVAGEVLPVFDLRQRFALQTRPIGPSDQFLIARTPRRSVVLAVDAAEDVIRRPLASTIDVASIAPSLPHIRGVLTLDDGLVLIYDLGQLLSPDEERALDQAMSHGAAHGR